MKRKYSVPDTPPSRGRVPYAHDARTIRRRFIRVIAALDGTEKRVYSGLETSVCIPTRRERFTPSLRREWPGGET